MRFLNFTIGNEEFGILLESVREVIAFPNLTPLPKSSNHFLGIMSLRDEIIPILDLRIRLNMEPTLTHETAVVTCDIDSVVFGVVVDSIQTVVSPTESEVLPFPQGGDSVGVTSLIQQIVRRDDKLILILDIIKVVNANDMELIQLQRSKEQLQKKAS